MCAAVLSYDTSYVPPCSTYTDRYRLNSWFACVALSLSVCVLRQQQLSMKDQTGKLEGEPCSQQRKRAKEDKKNSGKPSSPRNKAPRDGDDQLTSAGQKCSRPSVFSPSRTRRATADQDGDAPSKASLPRSRVRTPEDENDDDAGRARGNKSVKKSKDEPTGEGSVRDNREEIRKSALGLLKRHDGRMTYFELHRGLSLVQGLDRSMAVREGLVLSCDVCMRVRSAATAVITLDYFVFML